MYVKSTSLEHRDCNPPKLGKTSFFVILIRQDVKESGSDCMLQSDLDPCCRSSLFPKSD